MSASAIAGIGVGAPKLSVAAVDVPPILMRGPSTLGLFYGQGIPVPPTSVPGIVSVINSGDNPPSLATRNLVDEVSVASAIYDPATNTLTVVATTSDKGISGGDSPPALQLDGFPLADVAATRPAPHRRRSLGSVRRDQRPRSASGRRRHFVGRRRRAAGHHHARPPPAFPPGVPFAKDDIAPDATAGSAVAVVIQVKANDVAPADRTAPITPGPVTILAPGISPAGFGDTDRKRGRHRFLPAGRAFGYGDLQVHGRQQRRDVQSGHGHGQCASGRRPGRPRSLNPDSAQVFNGGSVNIPVLNNDSANDGTIDAASVLISAIARRRNSGGKRRRRGHLLGSGGLAAWPTDVQVHGGEHERQSLSAGHGDRQHHPGGDGHCRDREVH